MQHEKQSFTPGSCEVHPGQGLHHLVLVPAASCTALEEAPPSCLARGQLPLQSSTGSGTLSASWQQTACFFLFSESPPTGWYAVSNLQGQLHGCVGPLCQLRV